MDTSASEISDAIIILHTTMASDDTAVETYYHMTHRKYGETRDKV